jgi:alkanesulfonate monooxygenase SsuD/methylene tetrahydromethanopterin reductase-like flavin-dependent oxidoreductase (luciferase family)
MRSVGAIMSPYPHPPEALRDAVRAADDAGVAQLWIWEDCFRQSAYAMAGAALAWTERVQIGIGISPMPLRNVAATAMEIAALERVFPGRLLPGVGHGVLDWMRQVGAAPASPLTLMREYVPALRALLAGETVSTEGRYVRLRDVTLDWPPASAPPVFAAAEGPRTLRTAGEVADGAVLDSGRTLEEVAASIAAVQKGRAAAGRPGRARVAAYVVAAFGPGAAERAVMRIGARPDADERVLAGGVDEVAERAEAWFAAGIDDLVLLPPDGDDLTPFLRDVGEVTARLGTSA